MEKFGLRSYDLRPCSLETVRHLCEKYHGYGSAGASATYAFAVYEQDRVVAGYAWQPPPPGAAKAVCPEAPGGVLALSRMVAVPREERVLNHVSKPLRFQMAKLIDRTRWPVLVTYSDEGQGHRGHVYKCSGWEVTVRSRRPYFEDEDGKRCSSYSNGRHGSRGLVRGGVTMIQRWEQWICDRGEAATWMYHSGWRLVPLEGRRWRSGNQAHTWVKSAPAFGGIREVG